MSYDFSKLKGLITEKYGTQTKLAQKIDMDKSALSSKLNNRVRFTSDDVVMMSDVLGIPQELIGIYFFTQKV